MTLITGLLAALLSILGLGSTVVPTDMIEAAGPKTAYVRSALADVLDNFGGTMTGSGTGPSGLMFAASGLISPKLTEGLVKLNGDFAFTAVGRQALTFREIEFDLTDRTTYAEVDGLRIAVFNLAVEISNPADFDLKTLGGLRFSMKWTQQGADAFNAWSPPGLSRDSNDVDASYDACGANQVAED